MASDAKALEWIAKADKLMKKSFFTTPDPAGAAEAYEKAGNLYKLDKNWAKAGEQLEKAAACLNQDHQTFSAGRQYQNAAISYKNGNLMDQAIRAWKSAIAQYVEDGKFSQAGRTMKELAEAEEAGGDFTSALSSVTSAIEYLESANEPVAASQLKGKAGELAVECKQFSLAAECFESVAKNATLSFATVDPYTRATLCHLVGGDSVESSKCLERFAANSMDFAKSPEFVLLDDIVKAVENQDRAAFDEAIKTFKTQGKGRLDSWKTKLLTRIRESLPMEGDQDVL